MFDRIYQRQSVIARHRDGPLAHERATYLQHLSKEGRAPNTLMGIATILLAVARHIGTRISAAMTDADISACVDAWLTEGARFGAHRRHIVRTAAIFQVTAWLRYLRRYVAPASAGVPGIDVLADLLVSLRDERGFAAATLHNHARTIRPFLIWLAAQPRRLDETTLADISAYLDAQRSHWTRPTIACHVQSLRTFFRYAGHRGRCAADIADMIDAPRLYTLERLPQGPSRHDVHQLIESTRGDTPTAIRDHAILLLHAVYGFRSGEVRGLTLDDVDWQREIIRPPRPKQRRVGEYPLVREVGDAILRYLRHVRPICACRALFLTLKQPYGPLSASGLSAMVAVRQQRLGHCPPRFGPHGLRHASATYLLAEGFTLKQIGDHLGHAMVRATEIYAKVDLASLRQVGDVDLSGLVAHERQCADRSTPFFEIGDLAALREVAHVSLGGVR
jgi:site-specific recombinase XerD